MISFCCIPAQWKLFEAPSCTSLEIESNISWNNGRPVRSRGLLLGSNYYYLSTDFPSFFLSSSAASLSSSSGMPFSLRSFSQRGGQDDSNSIGALSMQDGGKISILSFVRNTGPESNNAARGPIQCRFRRIASGQVAADRSLWILSTRRDLGILPSTALLAPGESHGNTDYCVSAATWAQYLQWVNPFFPFATNSSVVIVTRAGLLHYYLGSRGSCTSISWIVTRHNVVLFIEFLSSMNNSANMIIIILSFSYHRDERNCIEPTPMLGKGGKYFWW